MPHDFFYFPKSDRRVIIILAVVAVCSIAALFIIDFQKPSEKEEICSEKEVPHSDEEKISGHGEEETVCLHRFDPNMVDSLTLVGFGLRSGQVKALLNYRRAGGKFRTPESISKLYGWSNEDVERLLPYVYIGEEFKVNYMTGKRTATNRVAENEEKDTATVRRQYSSDKFQTLMKVDPNTADSATLRRIPGIGFYISRSIIRYRERLGGFYNVEQLCEIKIFSPELLEWFEISSPNINTFNINEASFQKLNSHPYISYEQTRELLKYIRLYGKIKDREQLGTTHIFTEEEMEKLAPYITF